jgi:hypothetical protein
MRFLFIHLNRWFIFNLLILLSFCILSACDTKTTPRPDADDVVPPPITPVRFGQQILSSYSGSYALLIGESEYTNGWTNLGSIPGELAQVEEVLKSQGFTVEKSFNLNTRQLKDRFEKFIEKYGFDKNNRLLFFYSGHGHTREDKGYIVPVNAANPNFDEKGFLQKAVGMNQILTWARRIEAKHVLFLFDSCFSGTVFKARDPDITPPQILQATALPVRQFISAGGADETVPAKSVFTPIFIDALVYGWGDTNKDGYVTGQELGLYLWNKVPQHSEQIPQYGKIRDYDLSRGDFVFAIGGKKPGTILPQPQPFVSNITAQNNKVNFILPAGWNLQLSSLGCFKKGRTLECKLSAQDIKTAQSKTGSQKNKKDFLLNWGSSWENIIIPVDITKETHLISAEYLIPRWPFDTNDSWWQWRNIKYDNIATQSCTKKTPRYAIKKVIYSNSVSSHYSQVGRNAFYLPKGQLSTLQEIGWTYAQLPDTVQLTLEQQGSQTAKSYKHETTISWKLSEVTAHSSWFLAQRGRSELEKNMQRVSLSTRDLKLDGNGSYGVYQFPTVEACRQSNDGSSGIKSRIAVQHEQLLTVKPCEPLHFKVIDELNGQPISRCTQPDKNWIAFKPYGCSGKRKLIVVALGEKLDPYNQEIRKALVNAFQQYSEKPFTLDTITPGRQLNGEVFQCEDMPNSKTVGEIKRFIRRKLTSLRFGADDLDDWKNLELINLQYQDRLNELAGIFYVTDDAGNSDIFNYVGLPLKWRKAGVPLTVITTGSCQDWTDNQIVCQPLSQIGIALENFLRRK